MIPYFTMTNKEAATQVLQGYRMESPKECPEEIYKLILHCWSEVPANRPTFEHILTSLTQYRNQHFQRNSLISTQVAQTDDDSSSMYNNV